MNTKKNSGSIWDNFLDNIIPKKDGKSIFDSNENELTGNEILGICYIVINSLILLSNLWIVIIIVCTKLRRHFFHWKIVVCSLGDIIFGIIFSFEIASSLDSRRAWYYGDIFCHVSKYITTTHLIFVALALSSLCADRIIKFVLKRRCSKNFCHILLLLFPFVGAYMIFVPLLAQKDIVSVTNLTDFDQINYKFCKHSNEYEKERLPIVIIVEILQNTIYLPSLLLLVMIVICFYKKQQNVTEIEAVEEDSLCNHATEEIADEKRLMSSSLAVIIVTIGTVVCTIPNSGLYFCAPDCLPDDFGLKTKYAIPQYVYMVSLIPSMARPYVWLFDEDIRSALAKMFCCCCRQNGK